MIIFVGFFAKKFKTVKTAETKYRYESISNKRSVLELIEGWPSGQRRRSIDSF